MLSGCKGRMPDFNIVVRSPNGKHLASITEYEPRGTIDGQLVLLFDKLQKGGPALLEIHKGVLGWISDDEFAIVCKSHPPLGRQSAT